MVESEQLRDLSPETFYLLGKGEYIYTDDEIPMDEVLNSMVDALNNNKEKYAKYRKATHLLSKSKFIVLPKDDFHRCRAFLETNYSRACRSEEFKSSDERCNMLNELDWRLS